MAIVQQKRLLTTPSAVIHSPLFKTCVGLPLFDVSLSAFRDDISVNLLKIVERQLEIKKREK